VRLGCLLWIEHTLDRAGTVAQIDEDQTAEITTMPDPPL
jgi:hypothetical protein